MFYILIVATAHIVNKPDPKTMSKNKKKKLKKKQKQKQKMLELVQQQIQVKAKFFLYELINIYFVKDAEKQKQNLLASPDQINMNKMVLNDQIAQSKSGKEIIVFLFNVIILSMLALFILFRYFGKYFR